MSGREATAFEFLDVCGEIFGWMKAVGGFRRTRFRGLIRTQLAGYFLGAAYNPLRIARVAAGAVHNPER